MKEMNEFKRNLLCIKKHDVDFYFTQFRKLSKREKYNYFLDALQKFLNAWVTDELLLSDVATYDDGNVDIEKLKEYLESNGYFEGKDGFTPSNDEKQYVTLNFADLVSVLDLRTRREATLLEKCPEVPDELPISKMLLMIFIIYPLQYPAYYK